MENLRIHCIQHEKFDTPGCILYWAKAHVFSISYTHIYKNDALPAIDTFDILLIMGGSMSAYDDDKYSWMPLEKAFIKESIAKGKYIIGICLGSQMLASVLGVKVYPNRHKEIGFFPIYLTSAAKKMKMFKGLDEKINVFHWHGDTFDLPNGAQHLAYSHACHNQAFIYKEKVLGLQCHLEVTEQIMNELTSAFGAELISSPYVQSADEMRNHIDQISRMNQQLFDMLDSLILLK